MFILKKEVIHLGAVAIASMALAPTAASAFTLDAFNSFEDTIEINAGGTIFDVPGQEVTVNTTLGDATASDSDFDPCDNVNNPLSDTFGGCRTLSVSRDGTNSNFGSITLRAISGVASFEGADGLPGSAEIIWNGFDSANDGQDIENLAGIVQRSFEISVSALNLGTGNDELNLNFEIRDTSNNSGVITRKVTEDLTDESLLFPFLGGFGTTSTVADNSVDLQNIDYIRFFTDNVNEGDDFTFSLIQSSDRVQDVPIPGLNSKGTS